MSEKFDELIAVMERLRAPGGCPWDAEQSHESLKRYHPAIPASFGQTVVYGVNPMPSIIRPS